MKFSDELKSGLRTKELVYETRFLLQIWNVRVICVPCRAMRCDAVLCDVISLRALMETSSCILVNFTEMRTKDMHCCY